MSEIDCSELQSKLERVRGVRWEVRFLQNGKPRVWDFPERYRAWKAVKNTLQPWEAATQAKVFRITRYVKLRAKKKVAA